MGCPVLTSEYYANIARESFCFIRPEDDFFANFAALRETSFDSQRHVLASYNSNGTYSTAAWNCCSKDSETASDGTTYTYSYNLLKQMVSSDIG